jgi:hypothetical protein
MDAIDLQVDIFGSICEQKVETQRRRLVMGDTSTPMAVIMREQRRLRNLSEEGQIGILVWSDPWDTSGYELTEAFVNKWSHILKGCWKLLEATNRWRAIRGEKPIFANL